MGNGEKLRLQSIIRGCSKNKVDTEHVLAQVQDAYDICGEEDCGAGFVDVALVNTCGFIGDAKEESVNTILEVAVTNTGDALLPLMEDWWTFMEDWWPCVGEVRKA